MGPYYKIVTSTNALPLDPSILSSLEASNAATLASLDDRLSEAQKQEGESDIADALRARANHFVRIGDKERAVEAQKVVLEKTAGLGSRIDIVLTNIRIGFFFSDHKFISENMAKAEECVVYSLFFCAESVADLLGMEGWLRRVAIGTGGTVSKYTEAFTCYPSDSSNAEASSSWTRSRPLQPRNSCRTTTL